MSWSTGILQCTLEPTSCIEHICCTCCMIGRQCAASDAGQQQKDTMSLCGCCCGMFCLPLAVCQLRRRVATIYSIDEGCCVICRCTFLLL